jgi:CheY-like chemotaxis protein
MKKILLIDDSEIDLAVADQILNKKYQTYMAKSSTEALSYVTNGLVPDLILLDIIMPGMDGWGTLNALKGLSLLWNVPIVFLTSLDNEEDKLNAIKSGASGYITKPYEKEDFLRLVDEYIEKKASSQ